MDTKKDIGQFFNDRLNQMDFTPNEDGWNKIENELNEKKRKRRAFFWMFFASFLSGCLLTLLLIYSTDLLEKNTNINKNKNNFETVENSSESLSTGDSNNNLNENKLINEETETKYSKDNNLTNGKTETNLLKENHKNSVVSNGDKIEENNISTKSKQNKINRANSNSKKHKKDNISYLNHKFPNTKQKNKSNSNGKSKGFSFKTKSNQKSNNLANTNSNFSGLENTNASDFDKKSATESVTENSIKNDTTKINVSGLEVKDTTSLSAIAKKPIKKTEKLLEKDSTKVETENKSNTFIFSPYFGYGLTNKNQVTGNFKSTNKLNVSNEHYGFMLRWMANKKYGFQIGLGYINASTKTEIEKTNSNNLSFNDVENNPNTTFPPSGKLTLTHDLRLYEIPLEFYYKLNEKKIGFAFSTGISHTIIKNNDVYIESSQERTRAGSLQTITNQSFSANLKVYGIYKFSNKLQFELYPSFQYQFLNALKNKDLNPTILSFRVGLSYQF